MAESYFTHARPEIRALVPPSARRVLDVGCGEGLVGAALKAERAGLEVRGIEITEAAELAKTRLDAAIRGSADDPPPSDWPAPDCILFADVLEHLVDPWSVLSTWVSRLAPGGCVIVSLPNVTHWSIVSGLARGRFDYLDEGILDRTHLRFFTRETAAAMLRGAGLEIEEHHRVVALAPSLIGELGRVVLRREKAGRRLGRVQQRLADLCSYQLVFRARPTGS